MTERGRGGSDEQREGAGMSLSRRDFLRSSLLGAGALVVPGGVDAALAAIARGARVTAPGYGALRRDPAGLLDLPAGFQYRMLSPGTMPQDGGGERFNSTLTDGSPTPALHDGMASFAGPNGVTILVRNHEMNLGDTLGVDPKRARPYDVATTGGTTTLWVDRDRNLVKSFASLSGTLRNCAGGPTPWGSWLSAEECAEIPGARDPVNADCTSRVKQRHGYIFEVDSRSEGLVDPVPLKAMGRFRHEAVAVDPRTGFAYLTEDREDGLLYRFRPAVVASGTAPSALKVGDYARGGVLEALRVKSRPQLVTNNRGARTPIKLNEWLEVDWVPIGNVDPDMDMARSPTGDQTAPTSTRAQGFANGAAQFARSEGIVYHDGSVYLCCTDGGPKELGQVFRIRLAEQQLSLVVQSDSGAILDGPDNICVAPSGDLVICEDGEDDDFVVGVTPQGRCYKIARNAHPAKKELAGACWSADGETLFVNVQRPGMTFAIWGPWETRRA